MENIGRSAKQNKSNNQKIIIDVGEDAIVDAGQTTSDESELSVEKLLQKKRKG